MGQSNKPETIIAFECKDSNCTEEVTYKHKIVLGVVAGIDEPEQDKVVYLTCNNGHTHPYTITSGK